VSERIQILCFDQFETLDVFGPVEIFGSIPECYDVRLVSMEGGWIESAQHVKVQTTACKSDGEKSHVLLVPGGYGTRTLVNLPEFLSFLSEMADTAEYLLGVCTGSALLARAGLLDGKKATSNKMAFEWVKTQSSRVDWIENARWVVDGNCYTSSGVSAGMDMALGFISDRLGIPVAEDICRMTEYCWNQSAAEGKCRV
jgi:transcriptional regulator GlxA family with amidase domain